MPFKETPNGTTHFYNDGCGEIDHNKVATQDKKEGGWEKETWIDGIHHHEGKLYLVLNKDIPDEEVVIMTQKELDALLTSYQDSLLEAIEAKKAMWNHPLDGSIVAKDAFNQGLDTALTIIKSKKTI